MLLPTHGPIPKLRRGAPPVRPPPSQPARAALSGAPGAALGSRPRGGSGSGAGLEMRASLVENPQEGMGILTQEPGPLHRRSTSARH